MNFRIANLLAATSLIALCTAVPAFAQAAETVTIVVPLAPDCLDPCETPRGGVGRIIKQNVVETLVELDYTDGSVHPRLAEKWEQVTPTEWDFHLRPASSSTMARRWTPRRSCTQSSALSTLP